MRLRTLGGLALEQASFTRPKPLLLLAYLAIEGRRGRRFLADLFWGGAPDPRNNLATALAQLRSAAAGAVEADRERAWTSLPCDALEFLDALEGGAFERALDLYGGPFLEGAIPARVGVELEEWIYGTREYLADHARRCRLELARSAAARGAFEAGAKHAERAYTLVGASPPEARQMQAMHALLVASDHPRAAEVRAEARAYGLELTLTPERARTDLRAPASAAPPRERELPLATTSFVGRRTELADLERHLTDPGCRLLTLVGTAGVGKSRLALHLAHRLRERGRYPAGVSFVPFDALRDPGGIPAGIAAALGLDLGDGADPFALLARFIGDGHRLLLLDNFEQLIAGAGILSRLLRSCPELVLLVTSRERLHLPEEWVYPLTGLMGGDDEDDAVQLFLQRAKSADLRFGLTPEVLPAVTRICEAVEGLPLGVELAAAWTRVLPVAEIAAEIESNLDLFTARTDAVPERHRSLRAAFEHSWTLLTSEEQRSLRRLAVFRGGFTRVAAARVAGASIPLLASLVGKSLLRVLPSGRFDRHPLLYQFTVGKLDEAPAERREALREHARFFLALAEEAEPQLTGPDAAAWLARLADEHENLRVALERAEANRDVETGLRLATAILRFWIVRGHLREGRARLEALLAIPAQGVPTGVRAAALDGVATLLQQMGEWPRAKRLLQESLPLWREVGNEARLAAALNNYGWVLVNLCDYAPARRFSEEALALHREHGDRRGEAVSLTNLGFVAFRRGDLREAQALLAESLDLRRLLGNPRGISYGCANLGWVEIHLGEEAAARARIERADAINRQLGDDQMLGFTCNLRATLARRRGRIDEAARLFGEGIGLLRDTGSTMGLVRFLGDLADALRLRGERERARRLLDEQRTLCRHGGARDYFARSQMLRARLELDEGDERSAAALLRESLRTGWEIGDKLGVAERLEAIAELLAGRGDAAAAARLHAAAASLRAALEAPPPPYRRDELERALARLRDDLGGAGFEAAWRAGSAWTPEAAAAFALAGSRVGAAPPEGPRDGR